jgi:hypothetical protein
MADRYVVKKEFEATGIDIEMKTTFKPPEQVWWDDVEHSNPIISFGPVGESSRRIYGEASLPGKRSSRSGGSQLNHAVRSWFVASRLNQLEEESPWRSDGRESPRSFACGHQNRGF